MGLRLRVGLQTDNNNICYEILQSKKFRNTCIQRKQISSEGYD
jgi:hypothetical protein